MKFKSVFALFLVPLFCNAVFALTGRQIIEKSDALPEPKTVESSVIMKIHKRGSVVEKEFSLISKKISDSKSRALISFIKPTTLKLLSHSQKGSDSDQWLRMSSGRIKRIASSDKDKPFVGSHFNYEDMGTGASIDDFTYKKLEDTKVDGDACYKVEATKNKGTKIYDKQIIYVRQKDFFIVKVDLYKKGSLHKSLQNYNIKKTKGILTPYKVVMSMADGSGKTELNIKSIKYNMSISDTKFNKEALR